MPNDEVKPVPVRTGFFMNGLRLLLFRIFIHIIIRVSIV